MCIAISYRLAKTICFLLMGAEATTQAHSLQVVINEALQARF